MVKNGYVLGTDVVNQMFRLGSIFPLGGLDLRRRTDLRRKETKVLERRSGCKEKVDYCSSDPWFLLTSESFV